MSSKKYLPKYHPEKIRTAQTKKTATTPTKGRFSGPEKKNKKKFPKVKLTEEERRERKRRAEAGEETSALKYIPPTAAPPPPAARQVPSSFGAGLL